MPQLVRIGVLALQGSFAEHVTMLRKLEDVEAFEVRTKHELMRAEGLVIPGGESTTMALIAERWGLIPELRAFSAQKRPVWGTCAGAIFLAENATGRLLLDRGKTDCASCLATKETICQPVAMQSWALAYAGPDLQGPRRVVRHC